jgi:fructosamine-3-kinase
VLAGQLTERLGSRIRALDALHGGCIGQVYLAHLDSGERVVVKADDSASPRLDVEAYMLRYLRDHSNLPVPEVLHADPGLLVMSYIQGDSHFSPTAQEHAAGLLAALHSIRAERYGLERDTLIGGLHQPNPWTDSWLDFFANHRLLYMAAEAGQAGRLPAALRHRVERLAAQLERWLEEPAHPSLIHGDVWTTNVLAQGDRITGFVDPAIYYADPEIELAFTTLFGTFSEPFFRRYQELRPLRPGFFEERRDLYNLYPLLVHVRLFGGTYVSSVDHTLRQFGF